MSKVFIFTPRAALNAKENLSQFIDMCRNKSTVFGNDLPFDKPIWDISNTIQVKGRTTTVRVIFSSYTAAKADRPEPTISPNFLPFAQAYFRYKYGLRPTTAWHWRLAALRALDHVLSASETVLDVTSITSDIFDQVRDLIIDGYSQTAAAKILGEVQVLSDFLIENEFVQMKMRWLKNFSRALAFGDRVGAEADRAREEKLPSVEAIEAMAHVFHHACEPDELYVGSTLALLHCVPQRINETVRLRLDCEVEATDSQGIVQYGLKIPGSKGYEDTVRWIVPTMAEVARKAIRNLVNASTAARNIALWYEGNPDKIYLPEHLQYLRDQSSLSLSEVSAVLYGADLERTAKIWCSKNKIPCVGDRYDFAHIEKRIISRMPKVFPYAQPGLKFSEALFIARRFELDATLNAYSCLVDYIATDQISVRIAGRGDRNIRTVFKKFNLTDVNGESITVRSHQLRHYLNTLAQSNSLSQIDIALWSGRVDIRQNSAYDHVTSDALVLKAKNTAVTNNSSIFGGDLNEVKVRVVARREEATGILRHMTAHITDYGMCTHDYAATPCQLHRDCLNCNELVCVKGDLVKLDNLIKLRDETEQLLAAAVAAENTAAYGASRWVIHQRQTLEHCNKLIAILSDNSLADGAVVKLTGIKPASRLEQAETQREELMIPETRRRNKLLEKVKRG